MVKKKNKPYGLNRNLRLKSKIIIDHLFREGKSVSSFPIRLVYSKVDFSKDVPFLVGFSVPKKNFKKAVDRNRIKRLMRETFRLQQNQLKLTDKTAMMWLYTGKEMPDYNLVCDKIKNIIERINESLV